MYVVAQHTILDPAKYAERGQALIDPPQGMRLHAFLPSVDMTKATCLWEGPSREEVQTVLDTILGDASHNACYEVSAAQSLGLPAAAETAVPA